MDITHGESVSGVCSGRDIHLMESLPLVFEKASQPSEVQFCHAHTHTHTHTYTQNIYIRTDTNNWLFYPTHVQCTMALRVKDKTPNQWFKWDQVNIGYGLRETM